MSPLFLPAAKLLGSTTPLAAPAADTPVLSWDGDYGLLAIYYYIAGYSSGSTAIFRLGLTTTEDTGANYSSFTNAISTTTTTGTSRVSQTGVHVANATTTFARRGIILIENLNGTPKTISLRGRTFAAASPTAATASGNMDLVEGAWFNNGVAHCARLNGGGQNLIAGSFITAYGVPGAG